MECESSREKSLTVSKVRCVTSSESQNEFTACLPHSPIPLFSVLPFLKIVFSIANEPGVLVWTGQACVGKKSSPRQLLSFFVVVDVFHWKGVR